MKYDRLQSLSPTIPREAFSYGRSPDLKITDIATTCFFKFGGRPYFPNANIATTPLAVDAIGYAIPSMEPIFSNSHNGFALFLSRILRPFWSQNIVKKSLRSSDKKLQTEEACFGAAYSNSRQFLCNFSSEELNEMEDYLLSLKDFLLRSNNAPILAT
jgi:hypothetical protein